MCPENQRQGNLPGIRHIGVDITKVDAAFIVVDGDGVPLVDELDLLAPGEHGSPSEVLLDLKNRTLEHFRRLAPRSLSIYGTAKFANWKFNDLRPRCQIEAVLLLAAAELGVPTFEQTPHSAAKALGLKPTEIEASVPGLVDLDAFTRKGRRSKAFAAVLASTGISLGDQDDVC